MPDYRSMYDREYIGHWDLAGRDVTVTISKVIGGELTAPGGRKNKKPVLYFVGKEKGMVLNRTNGKTIAAMYGVKTEDWIGKRVILYVSVTRNPDGSGDVDCIRVRPTPPQGKATAPEQEPEQSPEPPPQQDGPPTITEVSALIQAGKLNDAEALAGQFPEASRLTLMAQIKAKRREAT